MLNPYLGANLMLLQKDGKFTIRNMYEQKKTTKISVSVTYVRILTFIKLLVFLLFCTNYVTITMV